MISVDKITLGEQQPESDHAIESDQVYTGYMEDRHFRDTRGWFSYRMFNKDRSAHYLCIIYFDADPNRVLNVRSMEDMCLLKYWKESQEQQFRDYCLPYQRASIQKKI